MINILNHCLDKCSSLHETWRNPLQQIDPKSWLDCFQQKKNRSRLWCVFRFTSIWTNNLGSPPKLWIYLWTHASAVLWNGSVNPPFVCWLWRYTWSRRPALRVPLSCTWLPPWRTIKLNLYRLKSGKLTQESELPKTIFKRHEDKWSGWRSY